VSVSNTITTSSGAVYTIPTTAPLGPAGGQVYISAGSNGGGSAGAQWIPTGSSTGTISIMGSGGGGGGIMNTGVISPNGTTKFTNNQGKTILTIPNSDTPSLVVDGSITWNGEDLNTRLKRIEAMLHIPTRDVTMEEKYKKLKELWEQYHKALDEYKTWETLKESK
jgi:hypothetical protein